MLYLHDASFRSSVEERGTRKDKILDDLDWSSDSFLTTHCNTSFIYIY